MKGKPKRYFANRRPIAIAHGHDGVWATAGLHPHDAKDGLDGIEELLADPMVVAVGECGLDYHYDNSPRDAQEQGFRAHIAAARETGLPLVIHAREADADVAGNSII